MSLEGRSIRKKETDYKTYSDGSHTQPETDSYDMLFDDSEKKSTTLEDKAAFLKRLGIDVEGVFTGQSIGKATINSPTVDKEQARAEIEEALRQSQELVDRAMDL